MLDQAAALVLAIGHHRAGRTEAAEAGYRAVLADDPDQPDALHLLGMMACDRGDTGGALGWIDDAIAREPSRAAFHNTRARSLALAARLTEAEAAYRTALELRPDSGEIANNLACLLRDRGDLDAATDYFRKAWAMAPGSGEIAGNLADILALAGDHDASLALFQQALRICPTAVDVHDNRGRLLLRLGRAGEAEQSFRAVVGLRPRQASGWNNLGFALQFQGLTEAALQCFRDSLHLDQACADAWYNLGCLLLLDNRLDEARDCQRRAVAADPTHGPALWARCMVELPVLYMTAAEIPERRARYERCLDTLISAARDPPIARSLAAAVGASQPFFLPYQGQCDLALQQRYGQLVTGLLAAAATPPMPGPPAAGEPIRVGLVSGYFCEHTIWRLMLQGWLSHLDRDRFDVFAYHTGLSDDSHTAEARRLCPHFTGGPGVDISAAILADRPHVLLYPELGMDPVSIRLAGQRLAPIQCVAWGQPQTSGLPTMDYFISSALMEPPGAASHYSEHLIALPGLGIHYTPDERRAETLPRSALGLRKDAVVFWCGQALYKYLPQYDDLLARIAQASGDCQFVFIRFAKSLAVSEAFMTRLGQAFAARGLDAGRFCVMLPPMSQQRFLGSIRLADIVLDSVGWSGGKSTLDALAEAPVIVTHAGQLMRGRHTAAILAGIGVTETIAGTTDAYVEIAVRLAREPARRTSLRTRMAAGRHQVMADIAAIRGLEAFLTQAAGQIRAD